MFTTFTDWEFDGDVEAAHRRLGAARSVASHHERAWVRRQRRRGRLVLQPAAVARCVHAVALADRPAPDRTRRIEAEAPTALILAARRRTRSRVGRVERERVVICSDDPLQW